MKRKKCPRCSRPTTSGHSPRHEAACARRWSAWQAAATAFADAELGLGDLFQKTDPYKLALSALRAFRQGIRPEAYVEAAFAEDFDRRSADEAEYEESLAHEFDG